MSTPNTSPPSPQPNPSGAPETTAPEPVPVEGRPARVSRPRRVATPESLALHMRRLDLILGLLVLIFAFFVASFAARNSDLWMHLAAGRLMAQGQYAFGADPFAFTTPRTGWTWINHAWLYDWLIYRIAEAAGGIETPVGGAVLVAIKAVLITILAGVMLWTSRRGHTLWVPAVVVALALLTMSPWLLLQPVCLSVLFLAITLAVLYWPRAEAATATSTIAGVPRPWLFLPLLFVLWVNLDGWFLLGPLTVGLYLLGEAAQLYLTSGFPGAEAPRPRDLRLLAGVLVLGLAACLLNPYHVHAFTLPSPLGAWFLDGAARDLPFLRNALISPFAGEYVNNLWVSKNWAGFAYYVLLLLGILSFVLNRAGLRCSRLLLWLAFGFLSIGLAGAIPFFAVAGGVITALNCQEWAARRLGTVPRVEGRLRRWSIAGRYLSLVIGLAVLALAWPGFLHAGPDDARRTRRVAWRVDVDPSYRRAALRLGELRERHVLGDEAHGFNAIPELADYFAWFCPREQGFLDHRYPLFRDVIGRFTEIRHAILQGGSDSAEGPRVEDSLRAAQPINHVILSGPAVDTRRGLLRLWDDPARWTMLYGDGRTFIFGWNDPQHPTATFRGHGVHFNALAYGAELPPQDRAPGEVPDLPAPRTWWELYTQGPVARPLAGDEAAMYQELFVHVQPWTVSYRIARLVTSWMEAPVLAPGGGGMASVALALQGFFRGREEVFLQEALAQGVQDPDPAGLLLLAVRAGRRGVAASPADADAYYQLGMAYLRLWQNHESPLTNGQFQSLQQLRQVQAVTAFRRAVRFQPDSPRYHSRLADMYAQMFVRSFLPTNPQLPPFNFTDLEMEHREKVIELLRSNPPRDRSAESVAKLIKAQEDAKKKREEQTQFARRKSEYEKNSANRSPPDQARLALDLGLVKEALDVLLKADLTPLNDQEKSAVIGLQMKLLIITGQTIMTNQGRLPDKDLIFDPWDKVLLAGAEGDYSRIEDYLEQILRAREQSPTHSDPAELTQLLQGLTFQGRIGLPVWLRLRHMVQAPLGWAELAVLRGLMALEEGDTIKAAQYLRTARGWIRQPARVAAFLAPLSATSPLDESLVRLMAGHQRHERPPFIPQALVYRYLRLLPTPGR